MRANAKTRKAEPKGQGYTDRETRVQVRCRGKAIELDGCELDVEITEVSRDGFRLKSNATRGDEAGGICLEPVAL